MQVTSMHFKERAHVKLHDARLQENLKKMQGKFVGKRRHAIAELDDFEGTREYAKEIRNRALENLDVWLELFEKNATARGATVLLRRNARRHQRARAGDREKARCAQDHQVEVDGLGRVGARSRDRGRRVDVVETDLGEYILQINGYEPPSHIIGPALHKSKEEVGRALPQVARDAGQDRDRGALPRGTRACCGQHYLTADMGISGGNFFVAETGSVVLVTNEGNATLATTLPKVHVAISGIEKIVPTLEDVATLMRLLPRSATGQSISNYVDVLTGPKGKGEFHGAEHMYFIVVDCGRTAVLGARCAKRCAASAAARA
jgi:L-lactate dehydrogenase complex protein LldF